MRIRIMSRADSSTGSSHISDMDRRYIRPMIRCADPDDNPRWNFVIWLREAGVLLKDARHDDEDRTCLAGVASKAGPQPRDAGSPAGGGSSALGSRRLRSDLDFGYRQRRGLLGRRLLS